MAGVFIGAVFGWDADAVVEVGLVADLLEVGAVVDIVFEVEGWAAADAGAVPVEWGPAVFNLNGVAAFGGGEAVGADSAHGAIFCTIPHFHRLAGAAGGDLHVAGGVVPVDVGAEGFGKDADWQQGAAVFDHWGDVALFGDAVVEVGGVTDDEIGGGAAFFHADAATGVVPDNAGAHGFGGGTHWQKDAAVFNDRRHIALDEGAVDVHRDGAAGLALRRVRLIRLRRRRQHRNKRRHQHSGQ